MEFPHKIIESIDAVKVKCVGIEWIKKNSYYYWIPKYETIKNV